MVLLPFSHLPAGCTAGRRNTPLHPWTFHDRCYPQQPHRPSPAGETSSNVDRRASSRLIAASASETQIPSTVRVRL